MADATHRGVWAVQTAILVNAALAIVELFAEVLGHAYALVADSVKSTADILSSMIIMGVLHVAAREPDDQFPFGHGKAESLAAATVRVQSVGVEIGSAGPIR
ncbi:MAG: cation transporter [Gemmatimonadaceae bacterium]